MMKKTIADLGDLTGKKVLIRVDFNVPLDKVSGEIKNDRRIRGAVPTIKALLKAGASVIAMSHLGRPSGDAAKDKHLTMDKVAERLADLLDVPVTKAASTVVGPEVAAAAKMLPPGGVLMLENVRFDPREQKNDPAFAAELAGLADAYVNDAFGTCHNDKDASMVAVPAAMKAAGKPRAVGLLVAKELEIIDGLMERTALGVPKNEVVAAAMADAVTGAEGHWGDYPAIVPLLPSGPDAAAPHLTWNGRPFAGGEATFFEISGCYRRYHAPLCRTIFLGTPPDFLKRA
ncbi:MAG: phosphoglycerate kinase, partial [Gemmataceae bacterium]